MEATTNISLAQLPVSCSFQTKGRDMNNEEVILCTLPAGICSIQVMQKGSDSNKIIVLDHEHDPSWDDEMQKGPDSNKIIVCREPHCVLTDWQVVEYEKR
jgi:hypothetical protein